MLVRQGWVRGMRSVHKQKMAAIYLPGETCFYLICQKRGDDGLSKRVVGEGAVPHSTFPPETAPGKLHGRKSIHYIPPALHIHPCLRFVCGYGIIPAKSIAPQYYPVRTVQVILSF